VSVRFLYIAFLLCMLRCDATDITSKQLNTMKTCPHSITAAFCHLTSLCTYSLQFIVFCIVWVCQNRKSMEHDLLTYLPRKMEQTECSETSAYKIQTPGNYPEENIQHDLQHLWFHSINCHPPKKKHYRYKTTIKWMSVEELKCENPLTKNQTNLM
jgi:hypothetical protein